MNIVKLGSFIGQNVTIFVRYGFKKKIEETQSYQGKLVSIEDYGVVIERKSDNTKNTSMYDFFPWHNIDAIRYR